MAKRRRRQRRRKKQQNVRTAGFIGRYGPGQENKFYDTAYAANVIAATGTIAMDTVCDVPIGTGESQRVGRKIHVKMVTVKGYAFLPDSNDDADTADIIKICVYADKQANGAAATIANLLASGDILSFNNLQNSQRFQTLKSHIINLQSSGVGLGVGMNDVPTTTTTVGTGRGLRHFVLNIPINALIEFSGTGSGVSDLTSNNIGIYAITQAGLIQLEMKIRIRYSDS